MKKLIPLFLICFCLSSFGQVNVDSLYQIGLNESESDTTRFNAYNAIIFHYFPNRLDSSLFYSNKKLKLTLQKSNRAEQLKTIHHIGNIHLTQGNFDTSITQFKQALDLYTNDMNPRDHLKPTLNIGVAYKRKGEYGNALYFFQKALAESESIDFQKGIASSLNNLGVIYSYSGDLEKTLDCYFQSLELKKEIKDSVGMAQTLANIAWTYMNLGYYEQSSEYHKRSIKLMKVLNDSLRMAKSYQLFSVLLAKQNNYEQAYEYCNKAIKIFKRANVLSDLYTCYLNLAQFYYRQKEYEKALEIFEYCKVYYTKENQKADKAWTLQKMGWLNHEMGNQQTALKLAHEALKISKTIGDSRTLQEIYELLYEVYDEQANSDEALNSYRLFIELRDSNTSVKAVAKMATEESRIRFEEEQRIKEQEEKEAALAAAAQEERRNSLEYSGITLGLFALFGLVFLIGRFRLPKWVIEFSVFLPFLILFEFILVLSDPYVESFAAGDPMIKLLINACIAGLIFPLHSFFERILKQRLFKSS